MAFLSHLKLDHGITYIPQRMTKSKTKIAGQQLQKMDFWFYLRIVTC